MSVVFVDGEKNWLVQGQFVLKSTDISYFLIFISGFMGDLDADFLPTMLMCLARNHPFIGIIMMSCDVVCLREVLIYFIRISGMDKY